MNNEAAVDTEIDTAGNIFPTVIKKIEESCKILIHTVIL
jgi:hypothetical protein